MIKTLIISNTETGRHGERTVSAAPRHCGLDPQSPVQPPVIAHNISTARRLADRTNPNRVQNPVRVTRDYDAPPRRLLHGRYHNTPPTPSQEGRAERRSAVISNTGSHLIILNSAFLILNSLSPVRVTRDCDAPPRGLLHGRYHNTPPTPSQEGRAGRRSAVIGNTGSYLIIFNSQFSILNSKEGRAERRSAVISNTGSYLIIFNSQFSILNSQFKRGEG
jgi:hypothetical protein